MRIWCLHGAVGHGRQWDFLAAASPVEPDVEVTWCAPTWWELWPGALPSLQEVGQWLVEQAEEGDGLLGYSLGGRLALHALQQDAQKWSRVLLVSTHPGLVEVESRQARRQHDAQWAQRAREWGWADFLRAWDGQGVLRGSSVLSGRVGLERHREEIAQSFEAWSLGQQADLRAVPAMLGERLRWVVGERDAKFTGLAHDLKKEQADLQVVVAQRAGHRVPWEGRAAFLEQVSWLRAGGRVPGLA